MTIVFSTPTATVLNEINVLKLTQADVAKTLAIIIKTDMVIADWKAINSAIVERWSASARERVLSMAWKIVESSAITAEEDTARAKAHQAVDGLA